MLYDADSKSIFHFVKQGIRAAFDGQRQLFRPQDDLFGLVGQVSHLFLIRIFRIQVQRRPLSRWGHAYDADSRSTTSDVIA